jgi:periplasmic protein TonB
MKFSFFKLLFFILVNTSITTTMAQKSYDQAPTFPNGATGLRNFIIKHMQPIVDSLSRDSVGLARYGYKQKVNLIFTVCEDGSICDFYTEDKNVNPFVLQESIKLMEKSPKWIPAKMGNKYVKAKHIQPVMFIIEEDE